MPKFDPKNVPAIANAVDQVLGREHPIAALVRASAHDESCAAEAWRMIEDLPAEHRRAIAGIFAVHAMPGVFGKGT